MQVLILRRNRVLEFHRMHAKRQITLGLSEIRMLPIAMNQWRQCTVLTMALLIGQTILTSTCTQMEL